MGVKKLGTLSPDSTLLATAYVIWDTRTGKELRRLEMASGEVFHAAFSPDGKLLAAGTSEGRLCLWDVATGKQVHLLAQHGGIVSAVGFSTVGVRWLSQRMDSYSFMAGPIGNFQSTSPDVSSRAWRYSYSPW